MRREWTMTTSGINVWETKMEVADQRVGNGTGEGDDVPRL